MIICGAPGSVKAALYPGAADVEDFSYERVSRLLRLVALPFSFEREDYVQILSDMAGKLGPALGWQPAADR